MSFATEQIVLLKAAYAAVLKGQSVRHGDRELTRADASWISAELSKWSRIAAREAANANGVDARFAVADFTGCGLRGRE